MTVTLSAITQPLECVEDGSRYLTADEYIAFVARVSKPSNQLNTKTAAGLLKYLFDHQHWSPFQLVSVCMRIETTRDISHQMIRHWSFDDVGNANVQEFSQRYAKVPADAFEFRECRMQDPKNRQQSLPCSDKELGDWWAAVQEEIIGMARDVYEETLSRGIAKEVARAILPEGNTKTTFYMAGTLRSWLHFIMNRTRANGAQKEHAEIAEECRRLILEQFPSLRDILTGA